MQLVMGAILTFVFLSVLAFLPETSHPGARGIDKVVDNDDISNSEHSGKWLKLRMPVVLNPFTSLLMLRSPAVLIVVSVNLCLCDTTW